MSLSDLYANTKKERKEQTGDKVLFSTHAANLKKEIDALGMRITSLHSEVQRLEEIVTRIDGLKMNEFTEKHKHMKESYNSLVTSYNQSQADIKSVIMDLSRRLNDLEIKF